MHAREGEVVKVKRRRRRRSCRTCVCAAPLPFLREPRAHYSYACSCCRSDLTLGAPGAVGWCEWIGAPRCV
ncbi:hypothetical protein BDA96_01G514800 [Sorghum bicolor]|uniref:Uncharacterized protein n=1 Tax=Sorghum bicolor TaxID=4558 RepID=A0A921S6E7_SORBI|nr:hypothetical protein BDA96_01G514800 [Sorghum bicolor]